MGSKKIDSMLSGPSGLSTKATIGKWSARAERNSEVAPRAGGPMRLPDTGGKVRVSDTGGPIKLPDTNSRGGSFMKGVRRI